MADHWTVAAITAIGTAVCSIIGCYYYWKNKSLDAQKSQDSYSLQAQESQDKYIKSLLEFEQNQTAKMQTIIESIDEEKAKLRLALTDAKIDSLNLRNEMLTLKTRVAFLEQELEKCQKNTAS